MQPTSLSVVQSSRVEQDYRYSDDRCCNLADLAVVVAVVLFVEVPDLGSIVVVVLVAPILHLPRHTLPPSLGNDIVAEAVAESV